MQFQPALGGSRVVRAARKPRKWAPRHHAEHATAGKQTAARIVLGKACLRADTRYELALRTRRSPSGRTDALTATGRGASPPAPGAGTAAAAFGLLGLLDAACFPVLELKACAHTRQHGAADASPRGAATERGRRSCEALSRLDARPVLAIGERPAGTETNLRDDAERLRCPGSETAAAVCIQSNLSAPARYTGGTRDDLESKEMLLRPLPFRARCGDATLAKARSDSSRANPKCCSLLENPEKGSVPKKKRRKGKRSFRAGSAPVLMDRAMAQRHVTLSLTPLGRGPSVSRRSFARPASARRLIVTRAVMSGDNDQVKSRVSKIEEEIMRREPEFLAWDGFRTAIILREDSSTRALASLLRFG